MRGGGGGRSGAGPGAVNCVVLSGGGNGEGKLGVGEVKGRWR
jgi:hypothetical protein